MVNTFDPCKPLKTRRGGRGSTLTLCVLKPDWMVLLSRGLDKNSQNRVHRSVRDLFQQE